MAGSVQVWTAVPDAVRPDDWPRLHALLDAAEQARAARFVFERHRRQHVAAHALKRLLLSALRPRPPASWRFDAAEGGKPRVAGEGPSFNISHCDGLVACAAGDNGAVGLDVEPLARDAPLDLAPKLLSADERAMLAALPGAQRPAAFMRLWTLKEAFVKATGQGLAQSLPAIGFRLDPLQGSGPAAGWNFVHRTVAPNHALSVACRAGAVSVREVRFPDLLAQLD